MPTVTAVRKEWASDFRHHHIALVRTNFGLEYTRAEVVAGLDRGEPWQTRGPDGSEAKIKKLTYCPASGCFETPYITTAPDHTTANNLDNLPTF